MSYIRDMTKDAPFTRLARQLGATLRAQRKQQGLTQIEVARRAGIGRQKLIQVEQGKPGAALAAYAATMDALDWCRQSSLPKSGLRSTHSSSD
jgi:DNA-binding XRE family transcriptional regulator